MPCKKRKYMDEATAQLILDGINQRVARGGSVRGSTMKKRFLGMHVYRCPGCFYWHLGHDRRPGVSGSTGSS